MTLAFSPQAVRTSTALAASSFLTTTHMPTPMLKVLNISRSLMPPFGDQLEDGRTSTLARSMTACFAVGQQRGCSHAGDVGDGFHLHRIQQGEDGSFT